MIFRRGQERAGEDRRAQERTGELQESCKQNKSDLRSHICHECERQGRQFSPSPGVSSGAGCTASMHEQDGGNTKFGIPANCFMFNLESGFIEVLKENTSNAQP